MTLSPRVLLAAAGLLLFGLAWAGEGGVDLTGDAPAPTRLRCRAFPVPLDAEVDTRDAATPLGQWVIGLEDQGWEVSSVDLAVGQKPTGFAQAYSHVCLAPR